MKKAMKKARKKVKTKNTKQVIICEIKVNNAIALKKLNQMQKVAEKLEATIKRIGIK